MDFDAHRAARKLVQPAFTLGALKGYMTVAERTFDRAVAQGVRDRRVDFKPAIRTLLASVASEIFTGIEDPRKVAVLDVALSDFWHGMMALSRNPRVSGKFRRAQEGFETLRSQFLAMVPERRKSGGADLFSRMCQAEDREGMSDEALVRIFLTIMFGAFDTTSLGMASMGYLLAKHPEWQERLREEAQAAGPELDVANLKNLKLHEWVWKETLRLMPVTGFSPRRALRDVEVGGYPLPAGTFVAAMSGTIGRHPKWWKDPTTFDPERFSPERAEDKQHPGLFNPFGAGAHACVGMQLANFEMKVFWRSMLRACRFTLEPDYDARHTYTPLGCVSGRVSLKRDPLS
jgi:cytochrome P450